MSTPQRIAIGFIAAVLSVLVFHQGMILLMRETGLFGISPTTLVWNIRPNPRAFTLPFIGEVPCMLCVAQTKIHAPLTN